VLRRGVVVALSAAILLTGLAGLAGLTGCEASPEHPTEPSPPLDLNVGLIGLSLVDGADRESTRFTASRAEYRTRRGGAGFITYYDLTELEFAGAELVLESAAPLPFSEYVGRFYRIVESVESDTGLARAGKAGKKTLTRVLFKDLRIIQVSQATTLVLSAGRARLALDSGTLILEGGMTVANDSDQSFEAPHAVLTRDYNALFARGGRWQGGQRIGRSVYLVVDGIGRLSTSGGMFEPTYADAVERRERMVLKHLFKRAPSALKPLVYALLQAGHSGRL
jgi:hypothetical protein